jgi:hypothetical protein
MLADKSNTTKMNSLFFGLINPYPAYVKNMVSS